MNYRDVVDQLGLQGVCLGGCGITDRSHRRGFLFLDTAHWQDRRVRHRSLHKFLRLVALRDRLRDPGFLNDPALSWSSAYWDDQKAQRWAEQLGTRFPAEYSAADRTRAYAMAPRGFARTHSAIWAWARRGRAA